MTIIFIPFIPRPPERTRQPPLGPKLFLLPKFQRLPSRASPSHPSSISELSAMEKDFGLLLHVRLFGPLAGLLVLSGSAVSDACATAAALPLCHYAAEARKNLTFIACANELALLSTSLPFPISRLPLLFQLSPFALAFGAPSSPLSSPARPWRYPQPLASAFRFPPALSSSG